MKYVVTIKRKTSSTWQICQKVFESPSEEMAEAKAIESFKKCAGDDWKRYIRIIKVEPVTNITY